MSSVIDARYARSSLASSKSSEALTVVTLLISAREPVCSSLSGGSVSTGRGDAGQLLRPRAELCLDDGDVEVDMCVDDRAVVARPEERDPLEGHGTVRGRHPHPVARLRARHGPFDRLCGRRAQDAGRHDGPPIEGAEEQLVQVHDLPAATRGLRPAERALRARSQPRSERGEIGRGERGRVGVGDVPFPSGRRGRGGGRRTGRRECSPVHRRGRRSGKALVRAASRQQQAGQRDGVPRHRHAGGIASEASRREHVTPSAAGRQLSLADLLADQT